MGTLYIRNLDERTHAILEKNAKDKNISVSELVRNILQNYAITADLGNIDDKYRSFTEDVLQLYKSEMEEVRMQSQMMMLQFMEKIEQEELLYEKIKDFFEEKDFE